MVAGVSPVVVVSLEVEASVDDITVSSETPADCEGPAVSFVCPRWTSAVSFVCPRWTSAVSFVCPRWTSAVSFVCPRWTSAVSFVCPRWTSAVSFVCPRWTSAVSFVCPRWTAVGCEGSTVSLGCPGLPTAVMRVLAEMGMGMGMLSFGEIVISLASVRLWMSDSDKASANSTGVAVSLTVAL